MLTKVKEWFMGLKKSKKLQYVWSHFLLYFQSHILLVGNTLKIERSKRKYPSRGLKNIKKQKAKEIEKQKEKAARKEKKSNTYKEKQAKAKTKTENKKDTFVKKSKIKESDVETYCQDARLLAAINTKRIAIISVLNYNKYFADDLGWYDSEGYPIYQLTWNGKDKATNQAVQFGCVVSGRDENSIKLHKLWIGSTVLHGQEDYDCYNKKGLKIK